VTRSIADMRRALAARDVFLAAVATKLAARVEALAHARSNGARHAKLAELAGFSRELLLIATPDVPVAPRARRVDVVALVARLLDPRAAAAAGASSALEIRGAAIGAWDAEHVETIVSELLSNAVKYARGGAVRVRVEASVQRARVIVENPGTWAGPTHAVARFARAERSADVHGFGVGLWLSRRLARANGGHLSFARVDDLTRATLTLPLERRTGDPRALDATLTAPRRRAPRTRA
jgi:signal transduction histidine kinase